MIDPAPAGNEPRRPRQPERPRPIPRLRGKPSHHELLPGPAIICYRRRIPRVFLLALVLFPALYVAFSIWVAVSAGLASASIAILVVGFLVLESFALWVSSLETSQVAIGDSWLAWQDPRHRNRWLIAHRENILPGPCNEMSMAVVVLGDGSRPAVARDVDLRVAGTRLALARVLGARAPSELRTWSGA
ncbi:MAG TPA: hypothetical protein VMD59_13250 [Acidimicrobiales bacterium]|nr:hypothetical protein [Acidimicrobiales bacterium]